MNKRKIVLGLLALAAAGGIVYAAEGYKDTPMLPGGKWHVHDSDRPHPPVIDPGTPSTQDNPGKAPSDALVLFDGKDLSRWQQRDGKPAAWTIEDGALVVKPGSGDLVTKDQFGDCQLHVEWSAPTPPNGSGQGRGNSGVFLMGRYEIQVLDCYQNPTYADGGAAAVYGQHPPLVNACRPPGEWQTYDIIWAGPRFDGDKLTRPAYVTVLHNGVLVQNHVELLGPMVFRQLAHYTPHGPTGPLGLQDHGNPVRYRNIWIRELKEGDPQ